MHITIDGTCWLNRRGYGRFARGIVGAMVGLDPSVRFSMVIDFDPAEAPPIPPEVRLRPVRTRRPVARAAGAAGRRSLADMWAVSRALSRERCDAVFFPTAYTYVPVHGSSGPIVVVVHDVIAEQLPQHVFPSRLSEAFWRLKLWAARRQATLLVTVSEASRRGIGERFGIAPKRIVVVGEGADPAFRPLPRDAAMAEALARFGLRERRFVLYVGGISPHKNLGSLLQAFAGVRKQPGWEDLRLVLAGDCSGDVFYSAYDSLRRQAALLQLGDSMIFPGYLADEQLVYLYNAAAAFVLPSLLEGFGLPAIEAMACGAPVVVSNRGALPEVVGPAGVVFDPGMPHGLPEALQRVLTDGALQEQLRRFAPARAAEFSWERAACTMLEALREVAG
jgi:glycosyltransferase involved in cell wall biosynthesis